MARADQLSLLYSKDKSPLEFNFDNMYILPLYAYISQYDIDNLCKLATSTKYASNIEYKKQEIDKIMTNLGFRFLHAGTNRLVYTYLEDQRIVAKVAANKTAMKDNPREFVNQNLLKPFISKTFCVSNCGVIALSERVQPITSKEEFAIIAGDVFDLLNKFIIGKYVLEDIGNKFFMNWGMRNGFGPCLLDYPYVFELDGNKLQCTAHIEKNGLFVKCDGIIDYDAGYNNLLCTKCEKKYLATELRVENIKDAIIRGGNKMIRVQLTKGDEILVDTTSEVRSIPIAQEDDGYSDWNSDNEVAECDKAKIIIIRSEEENSDVPECENVQSNVIEQEKVDIRYTDGDNETPECENVQSKLIQEPVIDERLIPYIDKLKDFEFKVKQITENPTERVISVLGDVELVESIINNTNIDSETEISVSLTEKESEADEGSDDTYFNTVSNDNRLISKKLTQSINNDNDVCFTSSEDENVEGSNNMNEQNDTYIVNKEESTTKIVEHCEEYTTQQPHYSVEASKASSVISFLFDEVCTSLIEQIENKLHTSVIVKGRLKTYIYNFLGNINSNEIFDKYILSDGSRLNILDFTDENINDFVEVYYDDIVSNKPFINGEKIVQTNKDNYEDLESDDTSGY